MHKGKMLRQIPPLQSMYYRIGKGLGPTKSIMQDKWKGNATVSQTGKLETKQKDKLRLIKLQKSE